MYVNEHLSTEILKTNIVQQSGVENEWIQFQCRKLHSIVIGYIYRHPKTHSDSFDNIVDLLRTMPMRNKTMFTLGDLNDELFNSNSRLSQIIKTNKLTQIIK